MGCFRQTSCCGGNYGWNNYSNPYFPYVTSGSGRGPTGPTGSTGPTGPTGPAGPQGPTGTFINENATIFNASAITPATGTALTLDSTLTNNGLTVSSTGITVTSTGTYLVSYGLNSATSASTGDYVAIAVNGVTLNPTERNLYATTGNTGTFILNLTAGNTISLIPTVPAATSITATDTPSAYLTVVRLA